MKDMSPSRIHPGLHAWPRHCPWHCRGRTLTAATCASGSAAISQRTQFRGPTARPPTRHGAGLEAAPQQRRGSRGSGSTDKQPHDGGYKRPQEPSLPVTLPPTARSYEQFDAVWSSLGQQLQLGKKTISTVSQLVRKGQLPCDAPLLHERAREFLALGPLILKPTPAPEPTLRSFLLASGATSGQGSAPALPGSLSEAVDGDLGAASAPFRPRLLLAEDPGPLLRLPAPQLRSCVRRLVRLLPDADPNLLVGTVVTDLARLPPELLALKFLELSRVFRVVFGSTVPPRVFSYLTADADEQRRRRRRRQKQILEQQQLWQTSPVSPGAGRHADMHTGAPAKAARGILARAEAVAPGEDNQGSSGLGGLSEARPGKLPAPLKATALDLAAAAEVDSATLGPLQLQGRLRCLCDALGREVAYVVLQNHPQVIDLDPAVIVARCDALARLLTATGEEQAAGLNSPPQQQKGQQLAWSGARAGTDSHAEADGAGRGGKGWQRGAWLGEPGVLQPQVYGGLDALWQAVERRGDVLLVPTEQLEANMEALEQGLGWSRGQVRALAVSEPLSVLSDWREVAGRWGRLEGAVLLGTAVAGRSTWRDELRDFPVELLGLLLRRSPEVLDRLDYLLRHPRERQGESLARILFETRADFLRRCPGYRRWRLQGPEDDPPPLPAVIPDAARRGRSVPKQAGDREGPKGSVLAGQRDQTGVKASVPPGRQRNKGDEWQWEDGEGDEDEELGGMWWEVGVIGGGFNGDEDEVEVLLPSSGRAARAETAGWDAGPKQGQGRQQEGEEHHGNAQSGAGFGPSGRGDRSGPAADDDGPLVVSTAPRRPNASDSVRADHSSRSAGSDSMQQAPGLPPHRPHQGLDTAPQGPNNGTARGPPSPDPGAPKPLPQPVLSSSAAVGRDANAADEPAVAATPGPSQSQGPGSSRVGAALNHDKQTVADSSQASAGDDTTMDHKAAVSERVRERGRAEGEGKQRPGQGADISRPQGLRGRGIGGAMVTGGSDNSGNASISGNASAGGSSSSSKAGVTSARGGKIAGGKDTARSAGPKVKAKAKSKVRQPADAATRQAAAAAAARTAALYTAALLSAPQQQGSGRRGGPGGDLGLLDDEDEGLVLLDD